MSALAEAQIYNPQNLHILHSEEQETREGYEVMRQIGYDPVAQARRNALLIDTLKEEGIRIASEERQAHEIMHQHEFVLDAPVSPAHIYHLRNGRLYSDSSAYQMTAISSAIHQDERDGETVLGFSRFESLIAHENNRVAYWYSHAGPAGSKPPFNTFNYDAGRLYFCFKGENGETYNLDVKIAENTFPIDALLRYLSFNEDTDPQSPQHYLTSPSATSEEPEFFLKRLEHFVDHAAMINKPTVYVSRRHEEENLKIYKWPSIVQEVRNQLYKKIAEQKNKSTISTYSYNSDTVSKLTNANFIELDVRTRLEAYMASENIRELILYGCSTTSRVSRNDLSDQSWRAIMSKLQELATPSIYGSLSRMRTSDLLDSTTNPNNSDDLRGCAKCGACNHVGLDVVDGNWFCRNCNTEGPKAPPGA